MLRSWAEPRAAAFSRGPGFAKKKKVGLETRWRETRDTCAMPARARLCALALAVVTALCIAPLAGAAEADAAVAPQCPAGGACVDAAVASDDNKCPECEQGCMPSYDDPRGYRCVCNKGWELSSDGRRCQDINECPGKCDHACVNTPGGHYCECQCNYKLAADGYSCVPSGCNATDEIEVKVGRVLGRVTPLKTLENKESNEVPCEMANKDYGGSISLQCVEGRLIADTKNCQPRCKLGPFVDEGQCSVTCGLGTQKQVRRVLQSPGRNMPPCADMTRYVDCILPRCPVDCEVSEWKESRPCSVRCGDGFVTETREAITKPKFGGSPCPELERKIPCCIPCIEDCELGPWKDAGECSKTCGGGKRLQVREVTRPAVGSGKQCPAKERFVDCNPQPCPVNCKLGNWTPRGTCSVTCGAGSQQMIREVLRNPSGGGEACGTTIRWTECRRRDCPVEIHNQVWASSECKGDPIDASAANLQGFAGAGSSSHCRQFQTDELDYATMISKCSSFCRENPLCVAVNWNQADRSCCFLSKVNSYSDGVALSTCFEQVGYVPPAAQRTERGRTRPSARRQKKPAPRRTAHRAQTRGRSAGGRARPQSVPSTSGGAGAAIDTGFWDTFVIVLFFSALIALVVGPSCCPGNRVK